MADRIRPALAQDTACSVLRPPNTTATRIFSCPTRPPVRHNQGRAIRLRPAPSSRLSDQATACTLWSAQGLQGHIRIRNKILRVLQANGEAYCARIDAPGRQRPVVELPVGGGGDVADQRVSPAQRGGE